MQHRFHQLTFVLTDIIGAELVWFFFLYFRWMVLDGVVDNFGAFLAPAFDFSISYQYHPLLLYPLGCILVYYFSGYYLRPGKRTLGEIIQNTFFTAILITIGAFLFIIIDDITSVSDISRYYFSIGILLLMQFGIVLLLRIIIFYVFRKHITKERVLLTRSQCSNEKEFYQTIANIFPTGKEIAIEPSTFDILSGAAKINHISESPIVVISNPSMKDSELVIKRSFDVCISILMLILLSPIMLIIALCIRIESKGPIIYKQERIGFKGKTFQILKFRTMLDNSEGDTPKLASEHDPRITKVGRYIRKYRLDETPQFVNVIKGDMSIVGPRPERAFFVEKITQKAPYYCMIFKVRPGLTSWGPIKVGYTDTLDKMIQRLNYDIAYIENMSLILDIKIMFSTIGIILDGKGK